VLLAEPSRTQFDLNFSLFGFPVRVHPLFWLMGVILGFQGAVDGIRIITWLVATFVSILIHELGHALMIRRFGRDAYIVLYMMGGLAIEGRPRSSDPFGNPWESHTPDYGQRARTPNEQILISAAGPGIQLMLAAIVAALVYASGGYMDIFYAGFIPLPYAELGGGLAQNDNLERLVDAMLYINIFWALVNLLPVLPLDGGQIALQILTQQDPWGGMHKALWMSVITGAVMAAVGALALQQMFVMILFGSLALSSFLTLQQMGGGGRRPW
jgi:membrane-associated protease RseP (regulator of RpoE activity)